MPFVADQCMPYTVLSVDHGMWTEWVSGSMFSSKVKPCSHVVTL